MLERVEALFKEILGQEGTRLPSGRRYRNRLITPKTGTVVPTALATEIAELAGRPYSPIQIVDLEYIVIAKHPIFRSDVRRWIHHLPDDQI